MTWFLGTKPFIKAPKNYLGFVYVITNLKTNKKYIGQKKFWVGRANKPPVAYKNKQLKESDWKDYWGSNAELQADVKKLGKKAFARQIIQLCDSKFDMSLTELIYQVAHRVWEPESNTYNNYIGCRLHLRK